MEETLYQESFKSPFGLEYHKVLGGLIVRRIALLGGMALKICNHLVSHRGYYKTL